MAQCASLSIGVCPVYLTTAVQLLGFSDFHRQCASLKPRTHTRTARPVQTTQWASDTHIPVLQTHPGNCPSLGMMSSQHRRRQSAYLSQGPAPHWFSTPRQYTARPMAQHSSQVCRASVVWTKPHKPASQQREASPGWLRHDKHSAD